MMTASLLAYVATARLLSAKRGRIERSRIAARSLAQCRPAKSVNLQLMARSFPLGEGIGWQPATCALQDRAHLATFTMSPGVDSSCKFARNLQRGHCQWQAAKNLKGNFPPG
jgi:hypothetical protein